MTLLKTEPTQRLTITEFMNHPWINVSTQVNFCLNSLLNFIYLIFYLPPVCHPKAINGGSSDPPSHQPGSDGREGRMGGSQGKRCLLIVAPSICCQLLWWQIEKLLNVKVDTYYLLRFQLFDNCKNPFTFKSSLGGGGFPCKNKLCSKQTF